MSIKKNIYKALLIILFAFVSSVEAASRYWVAANDGTDKMWHDNANWSTSSGGSGGASAPTSKTVEAIFDGNSTVNVKLGANVNKVKKLRVKNGYSGTIDLNGYHLASQKGPALYDGTVLVSAGSFLQTWGWFYIYSGGTVTASGDGSKIKVGHNLSIYGTLTAPTGDDTRFIVRGGFNLHSGGTFNHNDGTVTMATKWKSPGAAIRNEDGLGTGRNFYNLKKTGNKTAYLLNNIEVENDLTVIGKGKINAVRPNGTSSDITVGGNWDLLRSSNFNDGAGKVIFNGSSAQTIDSPANFNDVQISNSDVSLSRNVNITGTLTIDSGATLDINSYNLTAVTLANNGNLQLKGSETLTITTKDTDSGTITYDGTEPASNTEILTIISR